VIGFLDEHSHRASSIKEITRRSFLLERLEKSGVLHPFDGSPARALTDFDCIVSIQVGTADDVGAGRNCRKL
jgi:hypothetical protein